MKIKTYRALRRLRTFEDRFNYLKLNGSVGATTFGYERYINQILYHSGDWKRTRDNIIIRDDGCDLGMKDRDIYNGIIIHHLNPITLDDIEKGRDCVYDPENLICTTHNTHMAIHYGDENNLTKLPKIRLKGDTSLW